MNYLKAPRKWGLLLLPLLLLQLVACKKAATTSPVRKNIELAVFANGFVARDEEYTIAANAAGVLHGLQVKEGDVVNARQVIAAIGSDAQASQVAQSQLVYADAQKNATATSNQLQQIEQQINQAAAQLELDKTNYQRYKDLRATNSVSQLDYDKAELQYRNSLHNFEIQQKKYDETKQSLHLNANTSRTQLKTQQAVLGDYRLTADGAGTIINVYKKNGEVVHVGDPVAKVGSGSYLIKMYVSEDDIVKVLVGQKTAIHLNTYPDSTFWATVTKIYPGFDDNQQSYIIEARFDALPGRLFSGTQLQANIAIGTKNNALVIPAPYLQKNNQVQLKDGTYRVITVGNKSDQWVEVVSGLTEQDVIKAPKK
jgi:multidrug resistance efflux pump